MPKFIQTKRKCKLVDGVKCSCCVKEANKKKIKNKIKNKIKMKFQKQLDEFPTYHVVESLLLWKWFEG